MTFCLRSILINANKFGLTAVSVIVLFVLCLRVSTTTLGQFQSGLKTMLSRLAYWTWLGAFVTV